MKILINLGVEKRGRGGGERRGGVLGVEREIILPTHMYQLWLAYSFPCRRDLVLFFMRVLHSLSLSQTLLLHSLAPLFPSYLLRNTESVCTDGTCIHVPSFRILLWLR